jgi:NAD(P)-dependent dehydrogenase (short-subunit alcohol dehydrogenase family)
MDLGDKAVLVTGAENPVGTAIAIELARAGATVAVHNSGGGGQIEATCAAVRRVGVRSAVIAGDLGNPADVERIVTEIRTRFGRLHGLVNNAAVCTTTPIDSLREKEWDRIMSVNLKGPFLLAVHLGKSMAAEAGGVIVNIGDSLGLDPRPEHLAYCVSKAGIVALTQGLARALAPKVRVHCVVPAAPLCDASETPRPAGNDPTRLQRSVEAVARMVRFVMVQEELHSGGIHVVDGTGGDVALPAALNGKAL